MQTLLELQASLLEVGHQAVQLFEQCMVVAQEAFALFLPFLEKVEEVVELVAQIRFVRNRQALFPQIVQLALGDGDAALELIHAVGGDPTDFLEFHDPVVEALDQQAVAVERGFEFFDPGLGNEQQVAVGGILGAVIFDLVGDLLSERFPALQIYFHFGHRRAFAAQGVVEKLARCFR